MKLKTLIFCLFLGMFVFWHVTVWADLFEVRIESGIRRTSSGGSIPYDLFIPEPGPGLPAKPWPAIVLTPGFGRDRHYHWKNARYMAQRGMVVLTPDMVNLMGGESAQLQNIANTVDHVVWLSDRSANDRDPLAGVIDPSRMGLAGHSAGGAISFEAAVKAQELPFPVAAICLLDAVPWERTLDSAPLLEPVAFSSFRSEPSLCNAKGMILKLLDRLTFATEDVRIVKGTHCDPENPSDGLCSLVCGRSNQKGRGLYQRLMYLFFQDALRVPSVDGHPETYTRALDRLEAQRAVVYRPIPSRNWGHPRSGVKS